MSTDFFTEYKMFLFTEGFFCAQHGSGVTAKKLNLEIKKSWTIISFVEFRSVEVNKLVVDKE